MRLGLDVTPLAGPLTGIGRYVREVATATQQAGDIVPVPIALTGRSAARLRTNLPAGMVVRRTVPARPLLELWRHLDWPTAGRLFGPVDLVHGTNFYVPPVGSDRGELVTIHDLGPWEDPGSARGVVRLFPELAERAVRRGAHVHTLSHAAGEAIGERLGIPTGRVHPIPIGFDPVPEASLSGRLRDRIGTDRFILVLGTIERRKRVPELVDALAPLLRRSAEVRLVLAGGPGSDTERLDRAVAGSGVPDQVVRTGFVSDEERGALLRSARVVVSAARTEGFGLVPAEAMSVGTAVVATDVAAHREVCGEAALLVEPDRPSAWADAVAAVLEDDALRSELGRKGRARAPRFDWQTMSTALVELYRRLV